MAGRVGQRRKSSSAAIYIPVAVLIIMFIWIFAASVFFRVTQIEVTGLSRYTQEEVITAAGITQGDNLLLIDENSAVIRLQAAFPYVETIKIQRKFPDTVVIGIKESSAVAAVETQGVYWIVDETGRILERAYTLPRGLIRVTGLDPISPEAGQSIEVSDDTKTRLDCMTSVLGAINTAGLHSGVSKLDVTNISNISIVYMELYNVAIGSAEDIHGKLRKMSEVVEKLMDSGTGGGTILLRGDEPRFIPDD